MGCNQPSLQWPCPVSGLCTASWDKQTWAAVLPPQGQPRVGSSLPISLCVALGVCQLWLDSGWLGKGKSDRERSP